MKISVALRLTSLAAALAAGPSGAAFAQDASGSVESTIEEFSTICVAAVERSSELESIATKLGFSATPTWRNNSIVSVRDFRTDRNLVSIEEQSFANSKTVDCFYQTDTQIELDDMWKLKSRLEHFPLTNGLQGDAAIALQPGQSRDTLNAAYRNAAANPTVTVTIYSIPKFSTFRLNVTSFTR